VRAPAARPGRACCSDLNPKPTLTERAGTPLWVGGVGFLAGLTGLRCLALDRTHLAPAQLAALTGLTGLTSLALADTALDDGSAGALAGLTALRALDVSFTPLRSGGAAALAAAMPALAVLNLDGCSSARWASGACCACGAACACGRATRRRCRGRSTC